MESEIEELNNSVKTINKYCRGRFCKECMFGRDNGNFCALGCPPGFWDVIRSEPILTPGEHDYLKTVISQADRKITSICKLYITDREYIDIELEGGENAFLLPFDKGTKFTGMEREVDYSPEELGL